MDRIELLEFQANAASGLTDAAINYFSNGPDRIGGRDVPFVGQLKAVTGAGKTPILASVVGRMSPAIILWTTKYGAVVDQTVANLRGKYRHFLGSSGVEVVSFGDVTSSAEWEHLLEKKEGLTILVSTVATWNSSVKDERLNVHRPSLDWGESTRWDSLKLRRRRPLWVVYDEAHNTTTDQVELLDDLNPAGFFVASASQIKGKLQQYLTNLPEELRAERIIPVSTRAVVDAELLKSTIFLADYQSSTNEMLADAVARRLNLEKELALKASTITPKAIYVVETSNIGQKGDEARPVAIWNNLVKNCGVSPENIAVCTNTKNLPKDAQRVANIDQLSDKYTHIIFNKKLQEGWDDPSVYVCYFDGKTESATRIQQVIGRAVRQPGISHFDDEDLNTAYFYFNCPSELLETITDQLKEELRIYAGDEPGFEPFEFKQARAAPERIPVKIQWCNHLKAPNLQLEMPTGGFLTDLIAKKTYDFSAADRAAKGKALVNVVSVKTGGVVQDQRNLLEDMRIRCGAYLYQSIRSLSRNCANAIHPNAFSGDSLEKTACYNSKALEHYKVLAKEVVEEYENHVRLTFTADPDDADYRVEDYQPSTTVEKAFDNAAHPYYDTKAFRGEELDVAKALDKYSEYVWARNKDRLDYGIPLPIKSGTSSRFFPDFLWWVNETVWCIDPTGKFILDEKIRNKLLVLPSPLKIALITKGKLSSTFKPLEKSGWSLVRYKLGNTAPETFDNLDDLLKALVAES